MNLNTSCERTGPVSASDDKDVLVIRDSVQYVMRVLDSGQETEKRESGHDAQCIVNKLVYTVHLLIQNRAEFKLSPEWDHYSLDRWVRCLRFVKSDRQHLNSQCGLSFMQGHMIA